MLFYTLCMAKWKAYYHYIKEVLAGQGRGYDVDGDYHDLPAPLKCPVDGCRIWTWAKYEGCESDYEIYCVRHKWENWRDIPRDGPAARRMAGSDSPPAPSDRKPRP